MSTVEENKDRRRARRVGGEVRVALRQLGRPGETIEALTRDLSAGGLFIETDETLELGEVVELNIIADDTSPIRFRARVVDAGREFDRTRDELRADVEERTTYGVRLSFVNAEPASVMRLMGVLVASEAATEDLDESGA